MPALRKQIPDDVIAEAKRLYEQTLTPMQDIAAMMGVCRSTLDNRINEWKWVKRSVNRTAVDVSRLVRGAAVAALTAAAPDQAGDDADDGTADVVRATPVSPEQRFALAARIQSVIEREMAAVERVLDKLGPADQAEAERSARTLASLARTMREIAALTQPNDVNRLDDPDDDPVPRDLDDLRFELARRIKGLVEAERREQGEGAGGPDGEVA